MNGRFDDPHPKITSFPALFTSLIRQPWSPPKNIPWMGDWMTPPKNITWMGDLVGARTGPTAFIFFTIKKTYQYNACRFKIPSWLSNRVRKNHRHPLDSTNRMAGLCTFWRAGGRMERRWRTRKNMKGVQPFLLSYVFSFFKIRKGTQGGVPWVSPVNLGILILPHYQLLNSCNTRGRLLSINLYINCPPLPGVGNQVISRTSTCVQRKHRYGSNLISLLEKGPTCLHKVSTKACGWLIHATPFVIKWHPLPCSDGWCDGDSSILSLIYTYLAVYLYLPKIILLNWKNKI